MHVTDTPDILVLDEQLLETPEEIEQERGIEFPMEGLPFCIQNSPLSELRSGTIHIKNGILHINGRDTVPDYLRAKLYTLGSILFLPGLALTYYLIEQVSWIPSDFELSSDNIIAFTVKDDYSMVSILFNRSGSRNHSARRTLTFQIPRTQFLRVKSALQEFFPEKQTNDQLNPSNAGGSSSAIIGIILWIIVIVGSILWHPIQHR